MMPCTHHWLINERNHGICQRCGERRQFQPETGHFNPSYDGAPTTKQREGYSHDEELRNAWQAITGRR